MQGDKMKVKIGDRVYVNNNHCDEQFQTMSDPLKIYEVVEITKAGKGTSGQWAKLRSGIQYENIYDGEKETNTGWIDSAWLKVTKD